MGAFTNVEVADLALDFKVMETPVLDPSYWVREEVEGCGAVWHFERVIKFFLIQNIITPTWIGRKLGQQKENCWTLEDDVKEAGDLHSFK